MTVHVDAFESHHQMVSILIHLNLRSVRKAGAARTDSHVALLDLLSRGYEQHPKYLNDVILWNL